MGKGSFQQLLLPWILGPPAGTVGPLGEQVWGEEGGSPAGRLLSTAGKRKLLCVCALRWSRTNACLPAHIPKEAAAKARPLLPSAH